MINFVFVFFSTFVLTSGFGPRKLYTLDLPTTITSIKVIDRQIFFVGPWYISVIDNVHWKFMQKGRMNPRVINKELADPRILGKIPSRTFKGDRKPHFWVSTYGTNDTSGGIYILQLTNDYSEYGDISVDSGWNYERVQWVDMDKDGLRDCLTARFRGGIGQMLWFQQPPGQQIWNQKIIHEGMADGNFLGFVYDKKTYILIAGNQFNVLGLYWTMNRRNNWKYSRQVRFRVIDNYGKYYDVQYIDLNNDNRQDVLTTTVQISSSRGHVLGYEIPYDIQNANWKRRVLAAGFNGDYAPGKAVAYWPNKWKRKTDRPSIFLSGAGEEKLFILTPKPKTTGWGYIKASLQAGFGMIGIPYLVDLNKDSFPELFVPQGNQVHVFSYDYSSSVKEPPKPTNKPRGTSRNPKFPYRNPFFRPTKPSPSPAIPRLATPVAPGLPAPGPRNPVLPGSSPDVSAPNAPAPPPPGIGPISQNSQNNVGRLTSGQNRAPSSGLVQLPQNPQNPQTLNNPIQPLIPISQPGQSPNSPRYFLHNGQLYMYPERASPNNPAYPSLQSEVSLNTSNPILSSPKSNPFGVKNTSSEALPVTPENLVLSVTRRNFTYQSEARDACTFEKKVLCSLQQLSDANDFGGKIPRFDWGWFETSNRAARIEKCSPGNVKIEGYRCYNGIVEHLPVRQETKLPGLCCAVVNWATMTKRQYSRAYEAENECKNMSQRLCSLEEMFRVWEESSFKGHRWGWFRSQKELLRLAHYCDPSNILWPGYECIGNRLEITEIKSQAQVKGFCCPSASLNLQFSSFSLLFFTIFSLLFILKHE